MKLACSLLILAAAAVIPAHAGETASSKQAPEPTPLDDRWRFSLSSRGWMAGLEGDVGINGVISEIKVDPGDIIRRIDFATSLGAEASKGRFGITADVLYLSLSDGVSTATVVKKVDVQVDEIIGDVGLRWRVLKGDRGYLDVIGGVRYVNLFQQVVTQANSERIDEASERLVDAVGDRLRTAAAAALSERGLRELIASEFADREEVRDPVRASQLPIGPLNGRVGERLRERVQAIVAAKRAELSAAVRSAEQAVGAARVRAQARLADLKADISDEIADAVEDELDARASRTDDWYDPYIGLRGRYNFTDRLYATAKGDVGGFGVGSDFTWQAEAALGLQLTERISAEAGYRALGIDYEDDGLTYNVVTHGAQVTLGISF